MIVHQKLEVQDVFHRMIKLTKNNEFQLCIFKIISMKIGVVYEKKLHKFPSSDEGQRTSCLT